MLNPIGFHCAASAVPGDVVMTTTVLSTSADKHTASAERRRRAVVDVGVMTWLMALRECVWIGRVRSSKT